MAKVLTNMNDESDFGQHEFAIVMKIVNDYFHGLHYADSNQLRNIFHPDAMLETPDLRRSLDEWLEVVNNRPVPAEQNLPYNFRLLAIEIMGNQAMAKVSSPLFEFNYVDYLGLLKENDQWLIVNKMYANLA